MTFLIRATDTSGAVNLQRETQEGAIKKASELLAEGCWDVDILDEDGQIVPIDAFTQQPVNPGAA